ncbi:MAG: CDGSH iron-sulfur domain-containing protein [Micavibrio sp.]
MTKPTIAATSPIEVELKEGKKYWFCTCGQSQKQPFCDGAHKGTSFEPHVFVAETDGTAWLCRCKHTGNRPFCDGTHSTLEN